MAATHDLEIEPGGPTTRLAFKISCEKISKAYLYCKKIQLLTGAPRTINNAPLILYTYQK